MTLCKVVRTFESVNARPLCITILIKATDSTFLIICLLCCTTALVVTFASVDEIR